MRKAQVFYAMKLIRKKATKWFDEREKIGAWKCNFRPHETCRPDNRPTNQTIVKNCYCDMCDSEVKQFRLSRKHFVKNFSYRVLRKNCVFLQVSSASPALGCYWSIRKWPVNRNRWTLRSLARLSCSHTCWGGVAVNWEKNTPFSLNTL